MSDLTPGDLRRGYGPIYRRLSRCGDEMSNPAKLVMLNLLVQGLTLPLLSRWLGLRADGISQSAAPQAGAGGG